MNDGLLVHDLHYQIGDRQLLDGVSLTIEAGQSVAVTGPSGSGKSTLLNCVAGLTTPDAGRVTAAGRPLTGLTTRDLAKARRELIGVVFQFGELLPELTPVENVALPVLLGKGDHRDAYRRAEELLGELGVPVGDTPTAMLSGGERQRTAVARALITRPRVLLADEPTGALDSQARETVTGLLYSSAREYGCALLVVTHDLAVASLADQVLHLEDGALREAASRA